MEADDVKFLLLWPTAVMQSRFLEHLEGMKEEIYRLSSIPNNIKKSNYGGWQSDVCLHESLAFKPLCDHVSAMCAQVFKGNGARLHQMWACINKRHDQNLIHSHSNKYNLSGVYYLNVPQDSGDIVFRDPRPGALGAPYRLFKDDTDHVSFTPFVGLTMLFPSYLEHFVLPSKSDEDRISISFDLTLGQ